MTSLAEALANHGIRLKSYAVGDHYTTCPGCSAGRKGPHQKLPCLGVKIDGEGGAVWNCNHCNKFKGNIPSRRGFDHREVRHREPPKPARQPPKEMTPHEGMLQWFKEKRGISAATVETLGIYFDVHYFPQTQSENPAIVFPFRFGGQVVNNKYRDKHKNFAQDKDAMKCLYNVDSLIDNDTCIWAEGELDVAAMIEAGYPGVVSLPDGAPAKHNPEIDINDKRYFAMQNCAEQLAPIKKHIIAVDMDEAGKNLAYQLAHRLGTVNCWHVVWPEGCKDANETLIKHGADRVKLCVDSCEGFPIDGLRKLKGGELVAYRNAPAQQRFGVGLSAVDSLLTFRPGQVVVVTGYPGDGKSSFVAWISVELAKRYAWRWIICSPEHEFEELNATLAEQYKREPFKSYGFNLTGMTDVNLMEAETWIRRHYTMIAQDDENKLLDIDSLLKFARIARLRDGARALCIDPYNNFQHTRPKDMSETDYVLHLMLRLRLFAKHNDMVVFLLAHPSKMRKDPKDKKRPIPTCGDIAGSANFWNTANIAFTVYRPNIMTNDVELVVEKVKRKDQGRAGIARLLWDKHTGCYSAAPKEDGGPEEPPPDLWQANY